MKDILHKILSLALCVAYIFASCGYVRHVCTVKDKDAAYISLLVNNECTYCLENRNTEHQCCHRAEQQQSDDDCCEKTVQKITEYQNCSHGNDIFESIFSTLNPIIVFNDYNLICSDISNFNIVYPPPLNSKTPLIYFTGQLRL
ncbi:MAG: hypothetical protein LBH30_05905 [Prevotellaceae bacterium]|jgi:hypothetical protein|nr:hypothetical protein [Prevotellaceae bacterium]